MANLLDYIDWRGDLSFEKSPLNEVDLAVLATFSYIDLKNIVPADEQTISLFQAYLNMYNDPEVRSVPEGNNQQRKLELFRKMAASARYSQLKLSGYREVLSAVGVEGASEQFAAVTIILPDGTNVAAFRGTDDNLAGWKEDLYLTMQESIPAQISAAEYLKWTFFAHPGNFHVCGHSKGGNIGIYAAASLPDQEKSRILSIVNLDGPGFHAAFIHSAAYQSIAEKLLSIRPEYSIVGSFFYNRGSSFYVQTSAPGLAAHTCFSWELLGTAFVRAPGLRNSSRILDEKLETVLSEMDDEARKHFISELFEILTINGSETVGDITKLRPAKLLGMMKEFKNSPEISRFMKSFLEEYLRDLRDFGTSLLPRKKPAEPSPAGEF